MIIPKDSDINVKTLNIEEAKSPAISGLLKQLIVKPVVIEPQVKEGKKDKSAWYCYKYALNFTKGQLILKQNCGAITAPKKWT